MYVVAGADETTYVVTVENPTTPFKVVEMTLVVGIVLGAKEMEVKVLSSVTGEKVEEVPVGVDQR